MKQISLYHFPTVKGLKDVSKKLNAVEADSLFSALLHAFALRPIENEKTANEAERLLEYIERAFEQDIPFEIENYKQILLMLISDFDEIMYIP